MKEVAEDLLANLVGTLLIVLVISAVFPLDRLLDAWKLFCAALFCVLSLNHIGQFTIAFARFGTRERGVRSTKSCAEKPLTLVAKNPSRPIPGPPSSTRLLAARASGGLGIILGIGLPACFLIQMLFEATRTFGRPALAQLTETYLQGFEVSAAGLCGVVGLLLIAKVHDPTINRQYLYDKERALSIWFRAPYNGR